MNRSSIYDVCFYMAEWVYLDVTKPEPSKKSLGHSSNLHVVKLHLFHVQDSTIMLGHKYFMLKEIYARVCKRSIMQYFVLAYVGFNTTPVLCKHMYLRDVWQSLLILNIHQKDTRYNEIGLCAQKEDTIVGSQLEGPTWLLKVREESSLQPLITFTHGVRLRLSNWQSQWFTI